MPLGLGTTMASSDNVSTAVQKNLAPADLFLNTYSGASVAYSFRKLDNSYSGNCIRVVNDSSVALDIGFDGSGYLDTSAIATHCGSGNGKISLWYDQSGNSRNALAAKSDNQPLIFSSGSMVEVNNKAAALFDGGDRMVTGAFQAHTGSFYAVGVVQTPSSIGNENIFTQDDAQGTPQVRTAQYLRTASSTSSGRVVVFNTSGSNFADPSTSVSTSDQVMLSSYATSGGVIESFDNSATNGTSSYTGTLATNNQVAAIGSNTGSVSPGAFFNGHIQEIVLWDGDQGSTTRSNIERDVNGYYIIF